ncbi:MAG: sulfur carrier protein ThiS [Caulobacterales bacterium]|nr:sulfur carrier protein ThiS [Caulobacterales bacterium]
MELSITVNGEARAAPAGATIADLLDRLRLPAAKVAVERNLEIVPKSSYGAVALAEGDRIEIVHFVGGG